MTPPHALACVAELESADFRAFMQALNAFAAPRGLREFTNWSKVWEYPWLWRNGMGALNWPEMRVLDLGSELSPIPWYLASLGASVTLVESDKQWQPRWEILRTESGSRIDWHIVASEELPVADGAFDVVTSFSVIEHQPDKRKAIDEIARALRPGGMLAMSFDICEPDMGMTFPEWNGSALTLKQFDETIWHHPAFGDNGKLSWNIQDVAGFRTWNLQSAPHHNYVVGAAVLRKV